MKDTTQDMTEGMVLENAEASRDAGDEAARLEKENTDLKAELLGAKAQLAALMKELNQLMKISGESESGEATVQVQWGEEAEPWSE